MINWSGEEREVNGHRYYFTVKETVASTFLKKTIFQSGPKIWLHLYIEKISHFVRIQCFYMKMRFSVNVTYTE